MRLGSMVHSSGLALTRLELLRVRTLGAFVTATNNGPEVGGPSLAVWEGGEGGRQNLGLVTAMVTPDHKNETECVSRLWTFLQHSK